MESCQSLRSLITTNLLFDEEYFDTFRLFFYRPELHTDRTDDRKQVNAKSLQVLCEPEICAVR